MAHTKAQKHAVDYFTTLNCSLLFSSDLKEGVDHSVSYSAPLPNWIAQRVDSGYLSLVHSVNCCGVASISDKDLLPLGRFDQLTMLNISNHPITDQGIQNLSPLRKLRYLDCSGTRVTGAGFERLDLEDLVELYAFNRLTTFSTPD